MMVFMKKLFAAVAILSFLPTLALAQTTDQTRTLLIAALYAEVQVLEQEIAQIEAAQTVPVAPVQKPVVLSKQAQQTQYTQNCINSGTANYEAQGMDASQAYTKAIIACPN